MSKISIAESSFKKSLNKITQKIHDENNDRLNLQKIQIKENNQQNKQEIQIENNKTNIQEIQNENSGYNIAKFIINNSIIENIENVNETDDITDSIINDLPKFCENLESIISTATDILWKAYEDKCSKTMKCRLARDVKELILLQREIATITDNIESLKNQIEAVKYNKKEHKKKLKQLKTKEQRTKNKLVNERNKDESSIKKLRRENSLISVTTSQCQQIGETQLIPWVPYDDAEIHYRLLTSRQKPIATTRKNKPHHKVEIQSQTSEEGVTIYLTEIEPQQYKSDPNIITRNSSNTTINTNLEWAWPD